MSSFEPEKLIMIYIPMRNIPHTSFFDLYPEMYRPTDGKSNGCEKFWGLSEIELFKMVLKNPDAIKTWL